VPIKLLKFITPPEPPACRFHFSASILAGLIFLLFFIGSTDSSLNAEVSSQRTSSSLPNPTWPPTGKKIRCQVTKDTWISSVGKEKIGSNGGARRLKVKGQQEYSLVDIDPSVLRGKIITGALLHIRSASGKKAPMARVGVSTLASRWEEGTSHNYRPQAGSSCFNQAGYKKRNWAYPGSTVMDVAFGRGHTIWKFAECTPPDQNGWQSCAVDADVVAARAAGLSHGFFIYDEVGSIWSLKNRKFKYTLFPNRFFYSRESGRSAPWFEVWFQDQDATPPDPITSMRVATADFPPGQALVSWKTPTDRGAGKTLGFDVRYKRNGKEKAMPRYLIPMAGKAGEDVRMHIQDLSFKPGELISLTIRPVDSAGNVGPPFSKAIRLSANPRLADIPKSNVEPFRPTTVLPIVGGLKISVIDLLDKVDPESGAMIPRQHAGYKGGNHIYSAPQKRIQLQAARNETVCFQLNIEGIAKDIVVKYTFDQKPNLKPKIYQFAHVTVKNKTTEIISVLPDPLTSLVSAFSIPSTTGQIRIPHQNNLSLICEVYISHEEPPGNKKGTVAISVGKERLELDVDLIVRNFTLPNKLSFVPEMNAYGTVSPFKGYEYYRLAHEHRTCINRLPYNWSGSPAFAPQWNGHDFDWGVWDPKVGPLLDGSAFKDLRRKNEPVDVLYLPFNENWPISLFDSYTPSYWADEAFTPEYKAGLMQVLCSCASL